MINGRVMNLFLRGSFPPRITMNRVPIPNPRKKKNTTERTAGMNSPCFMAEVVSSDRLKKTLSPAMHTAIKEEDMLRMTFIPNLWTA